MGSECVSVEDKLVSSQEDTQTKLPKRVRGVRGGPDTYSFTKWTDWGLRPILLFAASYTLIGIVHEWAHALTAYALKVPSTLFHLYVELDRTPRTTNERALIGVSGPLFCLGVGVVCWFAARKAKNSRVRLLLLYLAWFGSATFFGNLMSTPFVGDFSALALAFQLPMSVRYVLCFVGAATLCALSFLMGRELRRWVPREVNSIAAMIGIIALPVILGSAIAILIFLPMSSAFAIGRAGELMFWIFGVVGTLVSRQQPAESTRELGLGWLDFAILLVTILVVRVMARGIALVP